ncbi:type III secretion protein [Pseudomonas putida]
MNQGLDMTSTSFQPCPRGGLDTFAKGADVERSTSVAGQELPNDVLPAAPPNGYSAEVQRMKAFAGQCKFRAPVADDFARGMLAPGEASRNESKWSGAWAVLINGLKTVWRGRTSG